MKNLQKKRNLEPQFPKFAKKRDPGRQFENFAKNDLERQFPKFATKKGPGRQFGKFAKKGSGTAIRKLQMKVISLSNEMWKGRFE